MYTDIDALELERYRKQTLSCWYLTGPTASGKSGIGITLAQKLGAEIISMDSMAIYRDMDIGTAKVAKEDRKGVAHHMIDIVDPSEEYSLARYVREARDKIDEIQLRNNKVLFVGGTPLYLKVLLRGIFEGPPADKEFRAQLLKKIEGHSPQILFDKLKEVDPNAAKRLHPNDLKRIVRALEVYELTGKPISSLQKQFDVGTPAAQCQVYALQLPRDILYARIEKRVDRMMYDGLLDEVRRLTERKLSISQTARQALGYQELLAYINGKSKFADAVNLIKQNTRNFAKRQETWFRSFSECRFISADKPEFDGLVEEDEDDSVHE